MIKVAAVQAEQEWLNLVNSIKKTCALIVEASKHGAHLVAFPELWICGYPVWIWARPLDPQLNVEYAKNSLIIDSKEMKIIRDCAAENNIMVCLGFSERSAGSLYIAQCLIGSDGELLMTRRKIKPFYMERTIFGDGNGPSLLNVVDSSIGRIGALSCGEHYQPLLKYHTYSQQEQIHVAAWPPLMPYIDGLGPYSMSKEGKSPHCIVRSGLIANEGEAAEQASRIYSIEAQAYTLHSTGMISERGIQKFQSQEVPAFSTCGGGAAAIFGPDGRKLSDDLPGAEEGLVYANLDLDRTVENKALLDLSGHNSRPDLLWLGVNIKDQKPVRSPE
ncbi:hypothetical protein N7486_005781 [Penicillium sp. IBT 16267x]|nr:hypothetical protein N7486_005781 [Penicillium sp. IBT 16267x]